MNSLNPLHRRAFCSLFGSALFLTAVGASPLFAAPPAEGKKWALLIGIDDYQDLNNLHAAANDARALAKTLKEVGGFTPEGKIRLLVSNAENDTDRPTRNNILNAISLLSQQARAGDTVYVMCFCHGIVDPETKAAYILPSDATASDEIESSLSVKYFRSKLDAVKPRVLLFAFDMCLTEPTRGTAPKPLEKNVFTQARGAETSEAGLVKNPNAAGAARFTTTLFGCSPGQSSWESKADNRGYFSLYLEKGLRGEAADNSGVVTLDALRGYVKRQVKEAVQTNQNGAVQEPSWNDAVQGDMEPLVLARVEQHGALTLIPSLLDEALAQLEYVEASDKFYPTALTLIAATQANANNVNGAKRTLMQAQQAAGRIADPTKTAQYDALKDIAEQQEVVEDSDGEKVTLLEAKQKAGMISSAYDKCDAYCSIAELQTRLGDKNAALATIAQAKQVIPQVLQRFQKEILGPLVEAQANAGDIKGAKQSASEIDREEDKSYAFRQIVEAQIKSGDTHEALITASSIPDSFARSLALGVIAAAQFGNHDRKGAQETLALTTQTVNTLTNMPLKSQAFCLAADAQVRVGEINAARSLLEQARQTAVSITQEEQKSHALDQLASLQAQFGDTTSATQTARLIREGVSRYSALAAIATAQTRAGAKSKARETLLQAKQAAATITGEYSRSLAFRWIAAAQAAADDKNAARETFVQAKQVAETISDASWKFEAFHSIADAQIKAGDSEASRDTLAQAARATETESNKYTRLRHVAQIAALQAKAGRIDEARQVAGAIDDLDTKGDALSGIAEAQAEAGDSVGAHATARTITDPQKRLIALCKIVQAITGRSNPVPKPIRRTK